MLESVKKDVIRRKGKYSYYIFIKLYIYSRNFRHLYHYRKLRNNRKNLFHKIMLYITSKNSGLELAPSTELGDGALFLHSYGITFNGQAKVGKNLTMLKGSTIGNIRCGKRIGVPVVGDNVYIGLNSTGVGNIKIGNNVLIAPNSFVNFDVPDNSVVIGNPAVIHKKENATEGYITNAID